MLCVSLHSQQIKNALPVDFFNDNENEITIDRLTWTGWINLCAHFSMQQKYHILQLSNVLFSFGLIKLNVAVSFCYLPNRIELFLFAR